MSDQAMVEPARLLARLAAAAGQPTWAYRFSYVASSLRATLKGALHATEIPFVFGTVRAKYGAATTPEDEAMAAAMNALLGRLRRAPGDPNGDGSPEVAGATRRRTTCSWTSRVGGPAAKPDPWQARLDLIERFASAPPAPAPAPPRVPTPNDTLVSTEVAPDRKVTFRIWAPKASEVRLRGDWMEGPAPSSWRRTSRASGRPPSARSRRTSTATPSLVDGVKTVDPKNAVIKQGIGSVDNMLLVAGPGGRVPGQRAGPARRDPHGLVPVDDARGRAAPARLHAARLRQRAGSVTRCSTCCTGAATRTRAGAPSGAPASSWTTCSRTKKAMPMLIVMPNGSLPRPANLPPLVPGTTPTPGGRGRDGGVPGAVHERADEGRRPVRREDLPRPPRRPEPGDRRPVDGRRPDASGSWSTHPDAFAYVAIWSAGVRPEGTEAFEKDAASFLAAPEKVNASIRLLSIRVGEKDFALPGCRNLDELLTKHRIEHKLQVNGGGHTWINWRLYLNELLPLLFR